MYTQCPECSVAFLVTAEVLKQAAGKVRCGGCGSAFNALEFLSETRPAPQVRQDPEPQLPELTPEPPDELVADAPPRSISAQQSAALLKTLDQLAGEDIRIEDTGVEWRVIDDMDDDYSGDNDAGDDEARAPLPGDETGSLRFVIQDDTDAATAENDDDAATQTSATDAIEDADEIEETPDTDDSAPAGTPAPPIHEELRFDDDTPLPDDFDFGIKPPVTRQAPIMLGGAPRDPETSQVDLELGDPEEWRDLLGEFADDGPQPDVAADGDELPADGLEELPDVDTQFRLQAEAMGLDISGIRSPAEGNGKHAPQAIEVAGESARGDDDEKIDQDGDYGEDPACEDETLTSIDDDLIAAAFEVEAASRAREVATETDDAGIEEIAAEHSGDGMDGVEPVHDLDDEVPSDFELTFEASLDTAEEEARILDELPLGGDSPEIEFNEAFDDGDRGEARAGDQYIVPEMTEEEKTINLMIDQDLLAIAVEDEDGFATTIVQKQVSDADGIPDDGAKSRDEDAKEASSPLVETIIMEGEFVRGEFDRERLAADKAAGRAIREAAARPESDTAKQTRGIGMLLGCVALSLLLGLQVVHQSREALATLPAFRNVVAPVYRALGNPVTPSWDVSGWRFEATKGSTDESEALLTIYSRIGNTSGDALPYPLVHVSLTDRFEEVIGSRVMEPSQYLVSDADPRNAVQPGDTFDAVISIESPAAEATGFKLNVCYRLATGQLRCAVEDFK